jgi:hypothetical protein
MILVEGLLVLSVKHEVGVEFLILLQVPLHGWRDLRVEHLNPFFLSLHVQFMFYIFMNSCCQQVCVRYCYPPCNPL